MWRHAYAWVIQGRPKINNHMSAWVWRQWMGTWNLNISKDTPINTAANNEPYECATLTVTCMKFKSKYIPSWKYYWSFARPWI